MTYAHGSKQVACLVVAMLCSGWMLPAAQGQGKEHPTQRNKKWNKRRIQRLQDYRDENGNLRPDLWEAGIEHYHNMNIAAGVRRPGNEKDGTGFGLTGVQWIQVGPQPAFPIESINFQGNGAMSGEVLDIAIDPRGLSDDVIYSVTNDGGVWRSTDGGATFEQKTDGMPSLSMGAVALDPVNPSIVYAGTGNLYDGNFSTTTLAVKAVGIYRSIDMGETWTILNPGGIFTGVGVARMAMPAGDVLLVGTSNGLYKSVNGGMTFGTAPAYNDGQPIIGGNALVEDIDLDVNNANTVYASVNGQGILVSTDAGDTFPAASNLFTNTNGGPAAGTLQFVRMAQAASNPTWLYATVQEQGNPDGDADAFLGLFRSTDTGANWTRLAAADGAGAANNGCQCGYDQTIGVDPRNHLRVYIGFQEMYLSTDGGVTGFGSPALSRNKIHWDHHYVGFSPSTHWGALNANDPTPMWVGTDGGVHSTSDGGATFNNFHNATIASNLFHHIDIGRGSPANNAWTYGGTQDTGTLHSCAPGASCGAAALASGSIPWEMGNNGDGSGVAVDHSNPLRAYGSRNGGYRFTNDGGQTWQNPNPGAVPVPPSAWRYAVDFNDTTRVWAMSSLNIGFQPGAQLWRSNDNTGLNWTQITTFASNVRAIANTPTDSDVVWFGHTNGNVQNTLNATAAVPTFSGQINIPNNPGSAVTEIAINPLNSDEVVVTYGGLCGACVNTDNRMRRVFLTTDAGATWNDISGTDGNPIGNLPNLPTHSVVYDIGTTPASIVVSNDAGVLRSANNGATWERFGLGLPTADCKMLKIDHFADPPLLRVGTYGRSVFELAEAQGPILAVNTDLGFDTVCIDERQTRVVQVFNVGSEELLVNAFFRAEGSTQFQIISGPATPVMISPGGEIDFTIEFAASQPGLHTATFQINSNDQFEPALQIAASGTVNTHMAATLIADSGSFGDICVANDFHDLDLTVANVGCGELSIDDIGIIGTNPSDFDVPSVISFPITVAAGDAIQIPIRFDPGGSCGGTRTATVQIFTNDPNAAISTVDVSGNVPCPDITVTGSEDFGDVCAEELAEKTLYVCNVGACNLSVTSAAIDCPDFTIINNPFPSIISPDFCMPLIVRFTPTSAGEKVCTLTITSDDPDEATVEIELRGNTPIPVIDVPPDLGFAPTVINIIDACETKELFPVSNNGLCNLDITDFAITDGHKEYALDGLPSFPIILQPGDIAGEGALSVVFAPFVEARERRGEISVTYVSDPITGAATTVTRELCGEGVRTGARVLVRHNGVPVDKVKQIHIRRINANANHTQIDTVETLNNAVLHTVTPAAPCAGFQYHREYGTVSNEDMLLPGVYILTIKVAIPGMPGFQMQTVGFDLEACEFNPTVIVDF